MEREIRELIREMNREMIREMNRQMQELKADMIREMNRGMNRLMQELKVDMIREMNREMNQEMQELKADMIRDMQRLVRSSSAEWNVNARCSLDHQLKKSEERELRLLFANQLPDKIFTRDKIRDGRDESIQIKLIDTISRETVELDPLSSIVIEIVVLDGDFGSDGNENWTEQEFNAKIVQQRKNGPLVKGKQNITLRKGVGIIDDLSFFDNSSWNACGKFRLGARVLQRSSMGQARIKEAISQPFAVRDYRGKRSQNLVLPSLDNDVSPLRKIKKNAKRHTNNNIHTVRGFNKMHGTNLNKQTEILEDCSDSDWEVIVQDASCVVDDKKLNASSNPILSQTTDPPLHYEFTAPYQGSAGMQNYRNHASSSHHKGGFSTAEEIVSNLASQPQDTSTGYPVNAQGVQSNSNFHPPTNGVSRRDSSQSNYSQSNCNPIITESSQINNGLHPYYYSPRQLEAEAYNSPTTGPLPHGYPVPQQGLAGMQNYCNLASTSQYVSALLQENDPNFTSQPVMSTHSPNNDFGDPTSLFSNLMTEYSPNDDGLLEQTMASHDFVSSKILTMSDIRIKPTLPAQTVNHMSPFMNGSHFLDLKAADVLGKEWSLCFYTRPNGNKKCPVFTTGWQQYVEAKGVRIGDRLIFSGRQVAAADGKLPEMQYTIRVTRPRPDSVTINGEPVTQDVDLDVEYHALL